MSRLTLSETVGLRTDLDQKLSGEDGDQWVVALKKFLRKENPWTGKVKEKKKEAKEVSVASGILTIDRSKPFDPAAFIGSGWTMKSVTLVRWRLPNWT